MLQVNNNENNNVTNHRVLTFAIHSRAQVLSREHLESLCRTEIEESNDIDEKYMYTVQNQNLTPEMRQELADWLYEVTEHFQFEFSETFALCMHLIDKICSKYVIENENYQLLGATCLLLAAKYHERHVPAFSKVAALSGNVFNVRNLVEYEFEVLNRLHWKVGGLTASVALEPFIHCMKLPVSVHQSTILIYADVFLGLVYGDYNFLVYRPLLLALTALYCSCAFARLIELDPDYQVEHVLLYYLRPHCIIQMNDVKICASHMSSVIREMMPSLDIPKIGSTDFTDSAEAATSYSSWSTNSTGGAISHIFKNSPSGPITGSSSTTTTSPENYHAMIEAANLSALTETHLYIET